MLLKLICLSILAIVQSIDNLKKHSSWNHTSRMGRQLNCTRNPPLTLDAFKCSSGQCIDMKFACNGKSDCEDDSDESETLCGKIACQESQFKCKYGACIDVKAQCNGTAECPDGSDEDLELCRTTAVTPRIQLSSKSGSCPLPQHPDFSQWSAENGTVVKIECTGGRVLQGSQEAVCKNGQWAPHIGQCSKTCPSRTSTRTMKITCISKNKETENCTEPVDGTLARFKCAPFFETNLEQNPVHLCRNGTWNETLPRCVPVCGGSNVSRRTYPWQAAIYNKLDHSLLCSGSLISDRVILTVAHCVTDQDGKLLPKDDYVVAVGKHHRSFNDSRDRYAQFSELEEMFVPDLYHGEVQDYQGDIAILVTSTTFTLSRRIQPVCLDRGHIFDVSPGAFGYVVGWGFTHETSDPADILRELKVPLVEVTHCKDSLPEDDVRFLTSDKLCAGYLDKGISVCQGDGGGGLVFERDGRFYITGIVSISPLSPTSFEGCDSNQYSLYTNVSYHIDNFILQKLSEYGY